MVRRTLSLLLLLFLGLIPEAFCEEMPVIIVDVEDDTLRLTVTVPNVYENVSGFIRAQSGVLYVSLSVMDAELLPEPIEAAVTVVLVDAGGLHARYVGRFAAEYRNASVGGELEVVVTEMNVSFSLYLTACGQYALFIDDDWLASRLSRLLGTPIVVESYSVSTVQNCAYVSASGVVEHSSRPLFAYGVTPPIRSVYVELREDVLRIDAVGTTRGLNALGDVLGRVVSDHASTVLKLVLGIPPDLRLLPSTGLVETKNGNLVYATPLIELDQPRRVLSSIREWLLGCNISSLARVEIRGRGPIPSVNTTLADLGNTFVSSETGTRPTPTRPRFRTIIRVPVENDIFTTTSSSISVDTLKSTAVASIVTALVGYALLTMRRR